MRGTIAKAPDPASTHRRVLCCVILSSALLLVASSPPAEPGHTFEVIDEDGIPTAVSSAIPKYEGEIFRYEKLLELRPDPDNFDETLLHEPRSLHYGA